MSSQYKLSTNGKCKWQCPYSQLSIVNWIRSILGNFTNGSLDWRVFHLIGTIAKRIISSIGKTHNSLTHYECVFSIKLNVNSIKYGLLAIQVVSQLHHSRSLNACKATDIFSSNLPSPCTKWTQVTDRWGDLLCYFAIDVAIAIDRWNCQLRHWVCVNCWRLCKALLPDVK